jgi:hypothetical protein
MPFGQFRRFLTSFAGTGEEFETCAGMPAIYGESVKNNLMNLNCFDPATVSSSLMNATFHCLAI